MNIRTSEYIYIYIVLEYNKRTKFDKVKIYILLVGEKKVYDTLMHWFFYHLTPRKMIKIPRCKDFTEKWKKTKINSEEKVQWKDSERQMSIEVSFKFLKNIVVYNAWSWQWVQLVRGVGKETNKIVFSVTCSNFTRKIRPSRQSSNAIKFENKMPKMKVH